ncbi:MAG TPA: glycosyltransferase family 1 protein [Xanthomonadaceae bacterium]|nr:glycosyltransferase family 1 protein [Xanthomonadaceae bacterium]
MRPEINAWRKEELQLPPAGWWRGWRRSHTDGVPILFGISPAILPFPQGWPATHSLTGFWLAEPDLAWEPSSPLQNFLQHDQPVVFLGFGSHIVSAALIRDVVIPAARRCRLRVVMNRVAGLDFVPGQDTDILAVDFVPYRWIFERVALVVHHCGVGTVAEALRAAVPMVLVPFSGEQRFWAERLWDAGVAGIPLNPQALTVETLATAFEQALVANPKVRQKQQELAFHLRQEEGVTRAVTIMEQHFAAC